MKQNKFSLVGIDGNAWCVMAYVNMAMRKCGKSPRERNAYMNDVMSGDYERLLCKSTEMLDRLNNQMR